MLQTIELDKRKRISKSVEKQTNKIYQSENFFLDNPDKNPQNYTHLDLQSNPSYLYNYSPISNTYHQKSPTFLSNNPNTIKLNYNSYLNNKSIQEIPINSQTSIIDPQINYYSVRNQPIQNDINSNLDNRITETKLGKIYSYVDYNNCRTFVNNKKR